MFLLLYGNADFVQASPALRLLAWTLPLWASTHVLGRALVASLKEKVTLRIAAFCMLVKLALGLILIGRFGLMGAAIAALVTAGVDFLLHLASVYKRLFKVPLARLAWKPAVATMLMALLLAVVGSDRVIWTTVSAGVVYTITLLGLIIWSNGCPSHFRAKYAYLLPK